MANKVTHFNIQADDFKRAKRFYEKVLGWKFDQVMTKEKSGMMDYWMIDTGKGPGIGGGMGTRNQIKKEDNSYHYDCTVEVEDIDKVLKAVEDNGGKILMKKSDLPTVGLFAKVKDTEGNIFDLMQPAKKDV